MFIVCPAMGSVIGVLLIDKLEVVGIVVMETVTHAEMLRRRNVAQDSKL